MKLALRKSFTDRTSTVYIVPDTASVQSALSMLWMEAGKLDAPFFIKVNGAIWLRERWNEDLPQGAFLEVFAAPGAGADLAVVSLVLTVASLAYSAYLIANMPEAPNASTDNNLPDSENVFSFSGQKNITKLNQTVETTYGRNKWFPSYFTLPRIYFVENRAYIDMWFSLGRGSLAVDEVRVGDTLVSDIANSLWSFRSSGVPNEAFDCVYIGDKTNTELSAPDEDNFETVTMIVTPVGALSTELQFNFIFNSGLARTVDCRVKYRAVDDLGRAQTPWSSWVTQSFTANTATPQRYSRNIVGLTAARYEVAVERVTTSGSERVTLISAYGLGFSGQSTPVQLLRVLLQGSNAIDESSASDVSVVTQRSCLTFEDGTWDLRPTRNPVWAILSILGSCGIAINDLDTKYWEGLGAQVTQTFDHVYTNKTTVWQALQDACSTFRGQMFVIGSDFRVAIDTPEATPVGFFGPDNATDLTWNIAFPQDTENDAVEAVYVDPVTGLQSSVQFTPPGSSGVNPRSVTLAGVTDRDQAWRTAAYKYLSGDILRDTVSFTAGMDGMIPMYGDLITVAWPFPAWAQAGLVHYQDTNGDLVVSEELAADGGPNWVSLRNAQGAMHGPVACTLGSAPNRIVLGTALPVGLFDFEDFTREATLFTFGKSTTMERTFRVTSATPDGESVKIEAVAYDTSVFTYDVLKAPANDLIPVADPGISWSQVSIASSTFYRIVWPAVRGATTYVVKYTYLPDIADNNAYVMDPSTFPLWVEAPFAEAFGTTAYLPVTTGRRIIVRITANTGEVAYWRGMSSGEPLVLTLGTGNVANAIRGTTGAVTFNASDIEMVYKVDPAIGGNCTVRYYVNDGVTISHIEVPVSDTGYAVISAEVLRRTGFAGKYGIVRVIYVHQGDTPEIVVPLTVNPIAIGVGMDNYVEVSGYMDTFWPIIHPGYTTWSGYAFIRKWPVSLIADTTGEYQTEWNLEDKNQITKFKTVMTDTRSTHISLWRRAICYVDGVNTETATTVTFDIPIGSPTFWRCVLIDGSGNQILRDDPTIGLFYATRQFTPNRMLIQGDGGELGQLPLTASEIARIKTATLIVAVDTLGTGAIYVNVKARLLDYYGGNTDWTAVEQLLNTVP